MKKLLFIVMALLLVMPAYAAGGAMIKASILRYQPTPAEQGNTVDVWVQLTNIGEKADKVAVKFMPDYPFSLPENSKAEIDVGSLAATESKVVKFTVFVDASAPNGDQTITFLYKYGSDNWIEFEAPISVQTQNSVVIVNNVVINPSPVKPGQQAVVELELKNGGRIGVKNVDVTLDLTDMPFSAIAGGAKKRVDFIPVGGSAKVVFHLASDTSTEVKLYNIPVELSYQDERNSQLTDTAQVSLLVNAQPEVSLTVDKTDFASKKSAGVVSIKVVNKGVVNMKYVTVRLIETDDYDVLSTSNEAYVGNLDSDDFETVDFTLKPSVKEPKLSVQLEFKDPYNVDYNQQYVLPLRIITAKDLGKGGMPWGTILVVLVLAGAGYWYWKKRKKHKK